MSKLYLDSGHPVCFCGRTSEFLSSSETLYGIEYGPVFFCEPCYAWVGCHKGTTKPLGIPATQEVRDARKKAHGAFDPIWQSMWRDLNKSHSMRLNKRVPEYYGKGPARKAIYAWLAEQMDIPVEECHISWFNKKECEQVLDICNNSKK